MLVAVAARCRSLGNDTGPAACDDCMPPPFAPDGAGRRRCIGTAAAAAGTAVLIHVWAADMVSGREL